MVSWWLIFGSGREISCRVLERLFKLKDSGTSVRNEIMAGVTTFMTLSCILFSFSITEGISFGFISYAVLKLASGRAREVHWIVYTFALLFVLRYVLLK
jgi:xanthine/uracil/vitamin C permease (AzgA family)